MDSFLKAFALEVLLDEQVVPLRAGDAPLLQETLEEGLVTGGNNGSFLVVKSFALDKGLDGQT